LRVQLVSSTRNSFFGKFYAFDHGNLLGSGHEGQVLPLACDLGELLAVC
jgi:hypothetical protein